jgi:hypothetical protein
VQLLASPMFLSPLLSPPPSYFNGEISEGSQQLLDECIIAEVYLLRLTQKELPHFFARKKFAAPFVNCFEPSP